MGAEGCSTGWEFIFPKTFIFYFYRACAPGRGRGQCGLHRCWIVCQMARSNVILYRGARYDHSIGAFLMNVCRTAFIAFADPGERGQRFHPWLMNFLIIVREVEIDYSQGPRKRRL